jgi:protein-L-isoaspartate(D-aspartate) O-methyltransferase
MKHIEPSRALSRQCGLPVCLVVGILFAVDARAQTRQEMTRQEATAARNRMVDREVVGGGVSNPRVIQALRDTPRHEFVPAANRRDAYLDMALAIGWGQTISPPFIVAYMTEQIDPQPTDTVLEIGTGSGYQAAVLSKLVQDVYTIEIVEPLGHRAAKDLKRLKYTNVHTKIGDGFQGWPEHAPFDKIIVTCSPEKVPQPLVQQLREGGRMIIPVGERYQQVFHLLVKRNGKLEAEALRPTLFVPMTGEAEKRRQVKPDPANPQIQNGSFEEVMGDPEEPVGWHYQRQLEVVNDSKAPSGKQYVKFTNERPGRDAHALQGFAVDGRVVKALRVSVWVRGDEIRANGNEGPATLGILFYDENRASVGQETLGSWRGTFAWQRQTATLKVPLKAREAVMRIGLFGATGELSLDAIEIGPASTR